MKNEKLLELIGRVDDRYVAEADGVKRQPVWIRWVALAACLAVVAGGLAWASGVFNDPLPKLTIHERAGEGMGMEAHMLHDASEWQTGNPWTEDADLTTLPVYRSLITRDEMGYITENRSKLDNAAFEREVTQRLGDLAVQATVELDPTSCGTSAVIEFSPSIPLPSEYEFTYHASYENKRKVAEYLQEEYADLIGMDDPVISISGGEYHNDGRQYYHIYFYENSETLTDQMLNQHFGYVYFTCNDAGELWMVRIAKPDLSDKMGDYPLISVEEAKEQLMSGNYISTVPEEYLGEDGRISADRIGAVELMYRNGYWDEYLIPYYRFLVKLSKTHVPAQELGLNEYGAYYVPAIRPEYIGDVVLWDGTFNQ